MSLVRLILNSNGSTADFKSQSPLAVGGRDAINNFTAYVTGVNGGEQPGADFDFNVGAVQATGSLTVATGGSVAAQACTILNVTFTGRAATPAANEFVVSATAATQAANMAAAINASASLAGKVTASVPSGGTVLITSIVPGLMGNGLQLSAGNLANVTLSAFANGTDGTAYGIDLR